MEHHGDDAGGGVWNYSFSHGVLQLWMYLEGWEHTKKIHPLLCSSQLFCVIQSTSLSAAQFFTSLQAVYKLSKDTHILLFTRVSHSPGNYIAVFPMSISILGIKFKEDLSLMPKQDFILWQSLSLFHGCCEQNSWSDVGDLGYLSIVISPLQFLLLISSFQWGFTRN